MDDIVIKRLQLNAKYETQLDEWKQLLDIVNNLDGKITIGLVGKYVSLQDAYLSVVESLKHAGYPLLKILILDGLIQVKLQMKMRPNTCRCRRYFSTRWIWFPCK